MKERPILMSAPMIKAILDGRKTITRRVIKRMPRYDDVDGVIWYEDMYGDWHEMSKICPYGQPGDRLWVRETMKVDDRLGWHYSADGAIVYCKPEHESDMIIWAHHKETEHCPSIHMPRWASRITLEVTGVRVERLQEISEMDAVKEGIKFERMVGVKYHRYQFRELWDKINGERGYSWESNPWIWRVEFKKI